VDLINEWFGVLVIAIQSIFGLTRGYRGVKEEGPLHLEMAVFTKVVDMINPFTNT
jgi:hypothetical protein